jgi:hypothetical protein
MANSECRDTKLGRCVLKEVKSLGRGAKRYLVTVELRQGVNTENGNQIWNKNARIQHLNPTTNHDPPQASALKNSTFCQRSAFMFCMDLREKKTLYSINSLGYISEILLSGQYEINV